MTRPNRKEEELQSLNAYFAAVAIRPDDAVEQAERPDFLLTVGSVRIGVEVTDYHVAGNRREVEEHWGLLRQWPMLLYDFPRNRHVELHFRALKLPSRRETQVFVAEVFDLTAGTTALSATFAIDADHYPVLAKYVSRVDIAASKVRYLGWSWNHDIAWVGVEEHELIAIVEAKRSSTVVAA